MSTSLLQHHGSTCTFCSYHVFRRRLVNIFSNPRSLQRHAGYCRKVCLLNVVDLALLAGALDDTRKVNNYAQSVSCYISNSMTGITYAGGRAESQR
jgi:hypothetical protein